MSITLKALNKNLYEKHGIQKEFMNLKQKLSLQFYRNQFNEQSDRKTNIQYLQNLLHSSKSLN